jgi:Rhodococcus equi virulence-associated protein
MTATGKTEHEKTDYETADQDRSEQNSRATMRGRSMGESLGRAAGETLDKADRAAGETLDKAHESLSKLIKAAAYPATGSVESFIFRMKFHLGVRQDGKTFYGDASSIGTPGGGTLFGDVYTDDIERLYNDTVSFMFESTPVYLSMQFFDEDSKLLGHLQSGAVSTVAGAGGGRGSWS